MFSSLPFAGQLSQLLECWRVGCACLPLTLPNFLHYLTCQNNYISWTLVYKLRVNIETIERRVSTLLGDYEENFCQLEVGAWRVP